MARFLAEACGLPVISKDRIKECMYDTIGFRSREEKVKLGIASMQIMYDLAEELMRSARPFILENNFENVSKEGLLTILKKYKYKAITVTLTGDYKIIYQRFLERNRDPGRHPGHVVNDCYPGSKEINSPVQISYESFVEGITQRGDGFFYGKWSADNFGYNRFRETGQRGFGAEDTRYCSGCTVYLQHSVGDVKVRSCPVPKKALIRECCYYTYPQRG